MKFMDIDRHALLERHPALIDAALGPDEMAIMSIDQGAYYGLNEIATRIWEMLIEPRSLDAICQRLLQDYDVDPATCEREVLACLDKLYSERLIRFHNDE